MKMVEECVCEWAAESIYLLYLTLVMWSIQAFLLSIWASEFLHCRTIGTVSILAAKQTVLKLMRECILLCYVSLFVNDSCQRSSLWYQQIFQLLIAFFSHWEAFVVAFLLLLLVHEEFGMKLVNDEVRWKQLVAWEGHAGLLLHRCSPPAAMSGHVNYLCARMVGELAGVRDLSLFPRNNKFQTDQTERRMI